MRYHCSNSWLFEKQKYVKMKHRVLRIYICIVNAFLWWDAIDRTVDCLFEKQNYIKMKHRVLRRKFYLKIYSFIRITSGYDTFELSFLRHVFPFVSFFPTCFPLSLFSPRVFLCLFFPHVFPFVSFFLTCFPLSLFSSRVSLCLFFSPGVCLCLFFPHVFPFVSFFLTCFPLSLFFTRCFLCFWFTSLFYHILTSNAFHVTHGYNARVLSPRRSL